MIVESREGEEIQIMMMIAPRSLACGAGFFLAEAGWACTIRRGIPGSRPSAERHDWGMLIPCAVLQ